ncbi:PREDICTED: putative F-box/LRR-repeat protein At3g42770 [Camelina sativa]|uniref:F-box/LRR-repeat protein At3g42770 n=1 Tax=Camelina sativa TaxID=90675 RepID=A0ABM0ZP98_CAMSA|nr:PREDICTED: putative F-box/LRR-repeat protein At3g42770 [Camelina sativa]XP_010518571.1 PREDICTED: putative F-box/LRR-repeat protein At3g42770 [Camelina sativa]XP_010518574.1 PREDICTED: putative F-box/LRR-repeat protein At3g42770 [Camelina sativa]XP_010518584.1 PREDICTED: putative F-box/LRR-repeat protein At3g42770 [Camelina sativa]
MGSMDHLPDEVLIKILSSLPTKEAVSTSALSKRWRTLFSYNLSLDFNNSTILLQSRKRKHKMRSTAESFRDFVDKTLALQSGNPMKSFSLNFKETLGDENSVADVNRWILHALKHGVSELHLRIGTKKRSYFPTEIFTSTTLVKLSLVAQCYTSFLPLNISLPALKVLFLDSSWFDSTRFGNALIPACPVLEDFTIYQKARSIGMPYAISSKSIKRLSVTYNCPLFVAYGIELFNTPGVVDLYYSDHVRHCYPNCHLESVAKATLDIHFLDDNAADVTELLTGICNVKSLHLTSSTVEVILLCCKGGIPTFENLVKLEFSGRTRKWKFLLPLLLECCPNLKTLVLSGLDQNWLEAIHIPPNNQVKMLRIMNYRGTTRELKFMSHFLARMECLEAVKIHVAPRVDDSKKEQLTEDLLKLPTTTSSSLNVQVM